MPRTKGSLNKKGKQSEEERILNRRAAKKNLSVEKRQKEYDQRKVARREKKIEKLKHLFWTSCDK